MEIIYRTRQFFHALNPTITPTDGELVATTLTVPLQRLFRRMSPVDQDHALAVLHTLQHQGEVPLALAQAALLHDVGKALGQPVFYRVLIVILQWLTPNLLARLGGGRLDGPHWRRPFVIHRQHPEIGANWAKKQGCDDLVYWLIRHHQDTPKPGDSALKWQYQARLYKADNLN